VYARPELFAQLGMCGRLAIPQAFEQTVYIHPLAPWSDFRHPGFGLRSPAMCTQTRAGSSIYHYRGPAGEVARVSAAEVAPRYIMPHIISHSQRRAPAACSRPGAVHPAPRHRSYPPASAPFDIPTKRPPCQAPTPCSSYVTANWPRMSELTNVAERSRFGQWTDMDIFRTSTRSLPAPFSSLLRGGHVRTITDLTAICPLSHSYRSAISPPFEPPNRNRLLEVEAGNIRAASTASLASIHPRRAGRN
jgi:hypothetical protein